MRYLISGYYGEGNAGDEAILAGMLHELRRHDPGAACTVLSFDPDDTRRRHDVAALGTSLRDPGALVAAMRSADVLLSGGGSFLHEADFAVHGRSFLFRQGKLRPIPYFLSVILLARAVGLPVMWYAQGLGPLHTAVARRLVAVAGSASQVVTWRDPDSARLAVEVGVRAPVQLVVPDPAYVLGAASSLGEPSPSPAARAAAAVPYVAVCLRPWLDRSAYHDHVAVALTQLLATDALPADTRVRFLPFQDRLDLPLSESLAAHPALTGRADVASAAGDPGALATQLGGALFAVTMRLHAGILAAAAGTPAVVIDYDPKVRAFAAQTGQTAFAVTADDLETPAGGERLLAAALATARDLDARRRDLRRRVASLKAEAGQTAALAVQVATHGGVPGLGAAPCAHSRGCGCRLGGGTGPGIDRGTAV